MRTGEDRRRKRRRSEEIMSWVLLPIMIVLGYVVANAVWGEVKDQVPSASDPRFQVRTTRS